MHFCVERKQQIGVQFEVNKIQGQQRKKKQNNQEKTHFEAAVQLESKIKINQKFNQISLNDENAIFPAIATFKLL